MANISKTVPKIKKHYLCSKSEKNKENGKQTINYGLPTIDR